MKTVTKKACYVAILLAMIIPVSSCKGGGKAVSESLFVWDEAGEDFAVIRHGIPAYNGIGYLYRRDGKALLEVELQAPVVVAVADKPEKWGYFQFPGFYRSAEGWLVATWQMKDDSPSSYGKSGSGFRISQDNGKTWYASDGRAPAGSDDSKGLFLPATGDRISGRTPVALNVKDLQLPAPVDSNKRSYNRIFSFYRLNELPEALQGVYLNRYDKDGVWSEIHAGLDDPGALRYSDNDLFPVLWSGDMKLLPDNSIVTGKYPTFYESESGGVEPSGISFYRSTDNGMNWKIQGKIPYRPDLKVDPNGNKRDIFCYTEPTFEVLFDGTFLCVMRTTDANGNSPMYISRSLDQGVNWSPAEPFTPSGVLPRLLQLENGVIVLASGRPGVQIRFSIDGKGEKWTDPFEMLPFVNQDVISCGYTRFLVTGPDRFLFIYSDFKYLDPVSGELRKAIKVREIIVTKTNLEI